jgi:dUTPase
MMEKEYNIPFLYTPHPAMIDDIIKRAQKYTTPFAILKIYVPDALKETYNTAIEKHNHKMETSSFPDSGFDLFLPEDVTFEGDVTRIDFGVKCEMQTVFPLEHEKRESNIVEIHPTAFYLFPRSSIAKKKIMLANSIGLIDSAYRGSIMAMFRYFAGEDTPPIAEGETKPVPYRLEQYERIVQIVHPSTYRVFVILVDELKELSTTERGEGSFGSTGK